MRFLSRYSVIIERGYRIDEIHMVYECLELVLICTDGNVENIKTHIKGLIAFLSYII